MKEKKPKNKREIVQAKHPMAVKMERTYHFDQFFYGLRQGHFLKEEFDLCGPVSQWNIGWEYSCISIAGLGVNPWSLLNQLVDRGVNLNCLDWKEETIGWVYLEKTFQFDEGYLKKAIELKMPVDLNIRNKKGYGALVLLRHQPESISFLLEQKLDPNSLNPVTGQNSFFDILNQNNQWNINHTEFLQKQVYKSLDLILDAGVKVWPRTPFQEELLEFINEENPTLWEKITAITRRQSLDSNLPVSDATLDKKSPRL